MSVYTLTFKEPQCNHFRHAKQISFTYTEGFCILAFVILHAIWVFSTLYCIVICGLSDCTIYFPFIPKMVGFSEQSLINP